MAKRKNTNGTADSKFVGDAANSLQAPSNETTNIRTGRKGLCSTLEGDEGLRGAFFTIHEVISESPVSVFSHNRKDKDSSYRLESTTSPLTVVDGGICQLLY